MWGREEGSTEPTPPRGLTLGHHHAAVLGTAAAELEGLAVGRVDLVEVVNGATEPARGQPARQLLGVEAVGYGAQAVAASGLALDVVATPSKRLDVLPDLGARDTERARQRFSRAGAPARVAQDLQHAGGAFGHRATPPGSISSATSEQITECVSAPIEIRCTPVSA